MISKNPLLIDITDKLALAQPDWEELAKSFKAGSLFQFGKFDFGNLVSALSELHLIISLEKICSRYDAETRKKIIFDPIKPGAKVSDYKFANSRSGQLVVYRNGKIHSEMDLLVQIDSLPVLFEVKLNVKRKTGRNIDQSPSTRGVHHAMDTKRANYLLTPICKYFRCANAGYVVVVPKNISNDVSPIRQEFRERNGIIVPFYTDKGSFRQEVAQKNKELKIVDESRLEVHKPFMYPF